MARTYKRDSNGRFAGGGGGGSGGRAGKASGKAKTTTARGRARSAEASARAKVKAGGGAKAARSLFTAQRARDFYKATGSGTKRSVAKGAAKAPAKGAAKAKAKAKARPAKMGKAAPNTAKQKYKAAASKVRELKMYRGGRTDATVKKAQATVKRMERSRRSSRARV